MPEPREYVLDGARGLIDLSWSQRAPQMVTDDIDKDPRYSQYPYQEANDYEEEEEDMEVDKRACGKTGSAHMAAPTSTWRSYCHLEATYAFPRQDQTPGSPRSIHTDTDVAMEMGGLGMGTSRSETHRVMPWTEALPDQTRMPDLVSSLTKGMTEAATQILEKFTHPLPVDDVADAAIQEHFQQRRAAFTRMIPTGMESSADWVSAFDWLGHRAQTPRKEEEWEPRPEMTPRKIDRGHQSSHTASSEPSRSTSQKRRSQSRPWDEGEPKKGCMKNEGQSSKVQVGIDWSTMGIQKPVSKPDLQHPSFKPDPSGVSKDQQPQVKSTVVSKASQKQSSTHGTPPSLPEQSEGQSGRTSKKTSGPVNPEKVELRDKPYNWIVARIHRLDPKDYVEEIHSLRHFHRNSKSFVLEIISIMDWGHKCFDVGLQFPLPMFPHYLFNQFAGSRQGGGQVPTKPDYLTKAGGDVQAKCSEGWIWMASILQFWMDEASIADGELFGGQMRLVSALAEYVMNAVNPVLPPGYKVTWDHVISHTPWLNKRLFSFTSEEEWKMRRQAIPVAGILSDLEVAMEMCYNKHIMDTAAQQKKKEQQEKPGQKANPSSKLTGIKNMGCGETIKLHLRKKAPGQDWTHVTPKDNGPDIGKHYETPQRQEGMGTSQAGRSPLTDKLLALGEHANTVLDDQYEDPEIEQVIANIPPCMDPVDVEMEDVTSGFEPEVSHLGYDVNLVRHSGDTMPGLTSPVTAQENQLLDEDMGLTRAPGTGRPGTEENPSRPITKKK